MQKDLTYHLSAIEYNDALAVVAEETADKVEHPEVKKWCRSVAKQHRFHAKRHRSALAKLEQGEGDEIKQEVHVEAQVAELVPATVEVEVDLDATKEN